METLPTLHDIWLMKGESYWDDIMFALIKLLLNSQIVMKLMWRHYIMLVEISWVNRLRMMTSSLVLFASSPGSLIIILYYPVRGMQRIRFTFATLALRNFVSTIYDVIGNLTNAIRISTHC